MLVVWWVDLGVSISFRVNLVSRHGIRGPWWATLCTMAVQVQSLAIPFCENAQTASLSVGAMRMRKGRARLAQACMLVCCRSLLLLLQVCCRQVAYNALLCCASMWQRYCHVWFIAAAWGEVHVSVQLSHAENLLCSAIMAFLARNQPAHQVSAFLHAPLSQPTVGGAG